MVPLAGAIAAAALFCAPMVGAAPSAQLPGVETFERTVPLAKGGSFSFSNINGAVEIEGWDRDDVRIFARKFSSGSPGDLALVGISVTATAGSVAVATRYPEGSGVDVNVDFQIRVPARVVLGSVTTVNGSVTIHDVSGSGSLAAVNGNVVMLRSAGPFSARTTNGNISIELVSLDGAGASRASGAPRGIAAQTVNGSIALFLPADAGAELDARTQNGDFSSDLPLLAHTSSAGRVVRGRVGGGGLPVSLRTVNGSIRLRIARPLV